jgi:hypothetical protein
MTEQPPLFPPPEPVHVERQKTPRSVAFAACPNHPYLGKLVGLTRGGRHLYWRVHSYDSSLPGRRTICGSSSAPLCSVPAREIPGNPTVVCPCTKEKK